MTTAPVGTTTRPVTRFNTIVTALDLHPAADRALVHVAALARAGALPVDLLTVCPSGIRSITATHELERRVAEHVLARAEPFVIFDEAPGHVIVDHVTGRDGVLLVIATTGHGGPDLAKLGTVTDEVLALVRQPVLVVGPMATAVTGGVLLAVDGTGNATAALPVVERWVRTFGAATTHVVEVLPPDAWPARTTAGSVGCVDEYVRQLSERGVAATGEVLRDADAPAALVAHVTSCGAAVLVVTAPPHPGQPSHWHETSRRLIRTSTCPVLVVPVP